MNRAEAAARDDAIRLRLISAEVEHLARTSLNLATTLDELREERRRALVRRKATIGIQLRAYTRARAKVTRLIEDNPGLFVKPRTYVADGIRFGLRKASDSLEGDAQAAIERIEERMAPEHAETLVKTTKSLVLDAVRQLKAEDLEAIGIAVVKGRDAVVLKSVGDDLDKHVKALGKELES